MGPNTDPSKPDAPLGAPHRRLKMGTVKTLMLAGLAAVSLGGAAMAQANNDYGQQYWSERALQAAPAVGPVQGLSHSFFNHSNTINRTIDLPSVGGGEG